MAYYENFVAGGSAGAAITMGAFFLREGNKLCKNKQRKEGCVVLTAGAISAFIGVVHLTNLLRK